MTWNTSINLTGPNGSTTDASTVGPNWYPSKYLSGNYYFCNSASTVTASVPSSGLIYVSPWVVTAPFALASLFAEHTAAGAGATLRIGIWNDDGYGRPGTLFLEAGSVSVAGTPGMDELPLSLNMTPGFYWVGGIRRSAGTLRCGQPNGVVPFHQPLGTTLPSAIQATWAWSLTWGTLPFTTWDSVNATPASLAPRIGFKVA